MGRKANGLPRTRICQGVSYELRFPGEWKFRDWRDHRTALRGYSYLHVPRDICLLIVWLRPSEPTDRDFHPEDKPCQAYKVFPHYSNTARCVYQNSEARESRWLINEQWNLGTLCRCLSRKSESSKQIFVFSDCSILSSIYLVYKF